MQIERFRQHLFEEISFRAAWREEMEIEHPDDERHARSAAALRELACRLEELPGNDPRLVRAWHLYYGPKQSLDRGDDLTPYTEAEYERLRTYGFHEEADGDPIAFLDSMIADIEDKKARST